jgi:peroxiredoxin
MRGRVKLALLLLLAGLAAGLCVHHGPPGPTLKPGEVAPDFQLSTIDGAPFALASLRGRIVVLNFWATWCPPCVEEMPSLEGLHQALAAEGLTVVGAAGDGKAADVQSFTRRLGLTFLQLHDAGSAVAHRYRAYGYPTTVVIDRAGRVAAVYHGPAPWDTPEALAHFRGLLARPVQEPEPSRTFTAPTR